MTYELWHVPSANLMCESDSLSGALDAAREVLETQGERVAGEIALLEHLRGRTKTVADGQKLVSMILERAPQR